MAFIPAIGAAILGTTGTAAATGFAATAVGAAAVGTTAYMGYQALTGPAKQAKAANKAAEEASRQNAAAIQGVKDAQSNASNAAQAQLQARARARSGSQTVYTSPLGISGQADTAKKKLLGE